MSIYHCSTKPIARSSGRSAVAAAAYRVGERLRDERQGIEHDYSQRTGVLSSELVLPKEVGKAWTREQLWNAAEGAEKRKDARTAREWEVALPAEWSRYERRMLAVGFAQDLAKRYGCAVDVAVHAPDREGDQRNYHAHLLATTRKVTTTGLGEKCEIELSDAKRLSLGLGPARQEVEAVRALWAEQMNRVLERKQQERVDHRSLERQRTEAREQGDGQEWAKLDREPQIKLGWKVVAMERRGIKTDRGQQLRQVQADNYERRAVVVNIDEWRNQQERARQQQIEAQRRQEAERQRQAEQQAKIQAMLEALRGKSRYGQEAVISNWRNWANAPVPNVKESRQLWEKDPYDVDARAWREARQTVSQCAATVVHYDREIARWHEQHRVQSRLWRYGARTTPRELELLSDNRNRSAQRLRESQKALEVRNQVWEQKRPEYEEQLCQQGESVRQAQEYLQILEQNKEHFDRFRVREAQKVEQQREKERQRVRGHDRGISF